MFNWNHFAHKRFLLAAFYHCSFFNPEKFFRQFVLSRHVQHGAALEGLEQVTQIHNPHPP